MGVFSRIFRRVGRDPKQQVLFSKQTVHEAVRLNNAKALRRAVECAASLDGWDDEGHTALHVAVRKGYIECAKLLLESGADPNILEAPSFSYDTGQEFARRTPLYYALKDEQLAELLIERGADIDDVSGAQRLPDPPLFHAIMDGDANAVRLLIRHCANVNVVHHGETPLQAAERFLAIRPLSRGWPPSARASNERPWSEVRQEIVHILREAGAG